MPKPLFKSLPRTLAIAMTAAFMAASISAMAANPPLFIVVPLEWTLPIVPSTNVIIQNAVFNTNNSAYDMQAPGGQSFIGLTRYAHVWANNPHPKVAYFWEVLQPYANVSGREFSVSGFGDPLFDIGWIQKWGGFQIEPQLLVGVPIGSSELTNHFWSFTPIFPFNWMVANNKLAITGTFAYTWNTTRHQTGVPDLKVGNSFFGDMIFTWMASAKVQPFVRYDYNKQNGTWNLEDASYVPQSDSHDGAVGAGLRFTFPKFPLTNLWYEQSVSGKNTVKTKAVYVMFAYLF
jgi:hypothetical protein